MTGIVKKAQIIAIIISSLLFTAACVWVPWQSNDDGFPLTCGSGPFWAGPVVGQKLPLRAARPDMSRFIPQLLAALGFGTALFGLASLRGRSEKP
jgi:hypothetical protein